MNQPESPGIRHESETRYRIAHLSDLHFGRHFNDDLWRYLEGLLQHEYRPDLIVVTGDIVDTPTLFGLGIAYQQLVKLQEKVREETTRRRESCQENVGCECQLLFVPGNHDVGILGNVALWPWRGKVRLVFHKEYRYHFARLPTFIEHRNKLWWKRWCDRVAWTCRFAGKRAFAWTKYLGADGTAGYDLRLMSSAVADGLVNEGRNLVIVTLVGTDLHIRIFDASGKKVVDKAENELVSGETLTALKKRLTPIPDESGLSGTTWGTM